MRIEDWFLTQGERGNDATEIDRRRGDGTRGPTATTSRCSSTVASTSPGSTRSCARCERDDWVHFTDWRGDPDERLVDGPDSAVARVLADLARRGVARPRAGVAVASRRGALQRAGEPAPRRDGERGGRRGRCSTNGCRRGGSHHQKLFVIRRHGRPDDDVAFVGGIDLCHGRRDDDRTTGDPQADRARPTTTGRRPRGTTSSSRCTGRRSATWRAPSASGGRTRRPLDHRNPVRRALDAGGPRARASRSDPAAAARPGARRATTRCRCSAPIPRAGPPYPFAPEGERSIARAYFKAFRPRPAARSTSRTSTSGRRRPRRRAGRCARAHARAAARRGRAAPPRPRRRVSGPPYRVAQSEAIERVRDAGGDRVAVFDLENASRAARSTCTPRSASSTTCG